MGTPGNDWIVSSYITNENGRQIYQHTISIITIIVFCCSQKSKIHLPHHKRSCERQNISIQKQTSHEIEILDHFCSLKIKLKLLFIILQKNFIAINQLKWLRRF